IKLYYQLHQKCVYKDEALRLNYFEGALLFAQLIGGF
ncbi:MAG: hypothetical protein RLZZ312_1308, partial [Bacteroidota bacterium]